MKRLLLIVLPFLLIVGCSSKEPKMVDIMTNEHSVKQIFEDYHGVFIDQVYYGLANYDDVADYNGFHLVDLAILIQMSNGKWLNWIWQEVEWKEDEGQYTTGISIMEGDIKQNLINDYTKIINVTKIKGWKSIRQKKIKSIKYSIKSIDNINYISDLKFEFDNTSVTICAIEEPNPHILPELVGLPYENNWTIVVFDEALLHKHNRLIN